MEVSLLGGHEGSADLGEKYVLGLSTTLMRMYFPRLSLDSRWRKEVTDSRSILIDSIKESLSRISKNILLCVSKC